MLCDIVYDIAYNITYYIACTGIIPNGPQISRSVLLMTGYAIMLKLQLQSFFFFTCTPQFVLQHVPFGHVPKDS